MDLKSNYFIFQTSWPGLEQSSVIANVSEKFNSEKSELAESEIEKRWTEKKSGNARLWAQTKFRLGAMFDENGEINMDIEQKNSTPEKLTIGIGITGTRLKSESLRSKSFKMW